MKMMAFRLANLVIQPCISIALKQHVEDEAVFLWYYFHRNRIIERLNQSSLYLSCLLYTSDAADE